jgi:serine/threonine protein kinase
MITENDHHFHIVMDYVEGGNLSILRQGQHHLPENHVKAIARSLLLGIAELHTLSIAHWNLCPENILLEPTLCDIVLCDFGCAWDMHYDSGYAMTRGHGGRRPSNVDCQLGNEDGTKTRTCTPRCGSLQYAAPEVLGSEKEFGLAADMWSVGVIVYQLLCGRLPFIDISKHALKEKITSGKFKFHGKEWHDISRGAKQFLSALLHPDPQVRMTVGEALAHPWMAIPKSQSSGNSLGDTPSKPTYPIKNDKHRYGLVKRLWGKWRSSSTLEPISSSPESSPTPLKSHIEWLLLAELNNASTLSMDSDSKVSLSVAPIEVSHRCPSWQRTLPRPLDEYRRLGRRHRRCDGL